MPLCFDEDCVFKICVTVVTLNNPTAAFLLLYLKN